MRRYEDGSIRCRSFGKSPMFREPVSSSTIAAIGYDEETEMLQVEFVSGAVYRYRSVNQDVFEDFRAARSKGRFFNQHIKDAYPWDELVARPLR